MEEIWKDIKGYEGYYQISNLGRVKSLERTSVQGHLIKERILSIHQCGKDRVNNNGYFCVNLAKDGHNRTVLVHQMVAEAFLPEKKDGQEVCHIDENRHNNIATNLMWGTHKDNCNYQEYKSRQSASQKGKQAGEKNGMYGRHRTDEEKMKVSRATSKETICDGIIFPSLKKCANYYDVSYDKMKSWMAHPERMPLNWKNKGLSYNIRKEVD